MTQCFVCVICGERVWGYIRRLVRVFISPHAEVIMRVSSVEWCVIHWSLEVKPNVYPGIKGCLAWFSLFPMQFAGCLWTALPLDSEMLVCCLLMVSLWSSSVRVME